MKICVYAICKNESAFVRRWVQSMQEADGLYVLDTGSTDDTVERLRRAGVHVEEETISPWRFDNARNRSLELVPQDADICVCTDLDEVFHPGWRKRLEAAWQPGTTRARYRYTWSFEPDGTEGCVFYLDKIHLRHGYCWTHPVHEVLQWMGEKGAERWVTAEGMQLDHHPDPNKSRGQYLPLLELSVQEQPDDDRNMHYLGREYLYYQRWDDCIRTLRKHLAMPSARWADERSASMRYIARAYAGKKDLQAAESWYWRAAAEAPYLREPWMELAVMMYRQMNWEAVIFLTGRALSIRERKRTYMTESRAWGSLPWDLRALGLYYTGQKQDALFAARRACALSPRDERLRSNMEIIQKNTEAG